MINLLDEKTNEYNTIHKRCSDFTEMEHQLEINVKESFYPSIEQDITEAFQFCKNRTKAMNFVNELADYCHLNEDTGNRLDQHMQFSSYCILEDKSETAMKVEHALKVDYIIVYFE